MRIAYVSWSVIPSPDAESVHVMQMAAAFVRQGHDVTFYAIDGAMNSDDPFADYGIEQRFPIVRVAVPAGKHQHLVYPVKVRRHVRRAAAPPDLLYGRHSYTMYAVARLGVPVVLDSHAPPWDASSPVDRALRTVVERRLFRAQTFSRLVCITDGLLRQYHEAYGEVMQDVDTVVAPNGAVTPPRERPAARTTARRQIGYVGSIGMGRGIELIVDLAERLPEFDFPIVGGDADQVAAWRSRPGLPPNVVFHGYAKPADVAAFYGTLDVVLAPYQEAVRVGRAGDSAPYMSPMKVFEYLAHGKPIVCSDLPVVREVLVDGETAILVPPANVDAWARAVRALVDDADLRGRLAVGARRIGETQFTWDARAQRVLAGLQR